MPPLLRALLLTLVLLVEGFASAVLSVPAAVAADDHAMPMAMPCHHDGASAPMKMPCCPDQDDQGGARCHLNCFGGANLLVPAFSAVAVRPESLPPRVAVAPATVRALPDNPFRPPASLEV